MTNCSDRWSIVAMKELAGSLRILEDQNWKSLARYMGFTRQEIKNKLQVNIGLLIAITGVVKKKLFLKICLNVFSIQVILSCQW